MVMNRYRYILLTILPALSALIASCEKEIELPYRNIDPIYVIEACMSNEGSGIRLSQTRDMDDSATLSTLNSAKITIEDSDGVEYAFWPVGYDGEYYLAETMPIEYDTDYKLNVEIDGESFTATSHLYPQPVATPINLTLQEFTGDMNMVFCSFSIMNQPDMDDYYRYRITVNSYASSWVLVDDMGVESDLLFQFMPLINKIDDELVDIMDGDTVRIDVQAIDKSVYNYFYTLNLSSDSGSNATSNIEGDCLGYFSAYSVTTSTYYVDYDSL